MLYQHFKGGLYLKLGEVLDCEDPAEKVVIYMNLPSFTLWARPKKSFDSMVEIAGNPFVPRFHRIRSLRELPYVWRMFRKHRSK